MLPAIRLEPVSDMKRWNIEPVRVLGRSFSHVTCGGNKSIFSKKTPVAFLNNVQILSDFSQKRLIFRVKGVWITGPVSGAKRSDLVLTCFSLSVERMRPTRSLLPFVLMVGWVFIRNPRLLDLSTLSWPNKICFDNILPSLINGYSGLTRSKPSSETF